MANQRLPIKMGDFSILDSEFGSVHDRFSAEMKKMEDEMNKFRGEFLEKESNFVSHTTRFLKKSAESRSFIDGKEVERDKTFQTSSTSSTGNKDSLSNSGLGQHSHWLSGLKNSPLIQESSQSGQKNLQLRFDVSEYLPEEIMVKTVDNKLMVHAKHEENTDGKSVFREYNREFLLPSGTNPETIRSTLSKDGILTVESPLPQPAIGQSKESSES